MSDTRTATLSIGLPGLSIIVSVLFILKVAGMAGASWGLANLSWWWVFSPYLFGLAIWGIFLIVFLIVLAGVAIFNR